MKCPNCNSNVTSTMCRNCGLDLDLYDKAAEVSRALYNKGLELANRRRLSDAVDTLLKSVEFDKKNSTARNLLGLCYFNCGKINEALKEWVISTSYNKKDNLADYYLEIFQENSRQMQKYDDSAHMYNQAIAALHQKSDDIAIIQLKKAVEYNPNFIDALNLLCLCYLNLNDRLKAGACIDRVLEIDVNNKTALSYYRQLYPNRNPSSFLTRFDSPQNRVGRNTSVEPALSGKTGGKIDRQLTAGLPISQFISFAIGAMCMFAVIYILILPSRIHSYENEAAEMKLSKEQLELIYETDIGQRDGKIEALEKELETQKSQNEKLMNDIDIQARVQKINVASGYLQQNQPEDAVNYLETVETAGLPAEAIETYNYIIETAYPLIEADYYGQGVAAYNAKNYEDSEVFLKKSINYARADSKTVGDAYYFLGRIAELAGDNDIARQYFEIVVNGYDNAKYYNTAKTRLENLR